MTKVEIKSRWTGAVIYSCDVPDDVPSGIALRHALEKAAVSRTNLIGTNLRGADLRGADLIGANLRDANLSEQKNDFWNILIHAPAEIQGLRLALTEGRVDGSTYEGPCACLVGTIANVRHANYQEIGIKPDSTRPAERWFMGIKEGDTPETNQISRITVEWLDKFVMLLDAARVNPYSHDATTK